MHPWRLPAAWSSTLRTFFLSQRLTLPDWQWRFLSALGWRWWLGLPEITSFLLKETLCCCLEELPWSSLPLSWTRSPIACARKPRSHEPQRYRHQPYRWRPYGDFLPLRFQGHGR